jgi:hypothetical protein
MVMVRSGVTVALGLALTSAESRQRIFMDVPPDGWANSERLSQNLHFKQS